MDHMRISGTEPSSVIPEVIDNGTIGEVVNIQDFEPVSLISISCSVYGFEGSD